MKNRERWLFLGKLVAGTIVLGLIWFLWLSERYPFVLRPVGNWIFPIIGVSKWRLSATLAHMVNMVPYVALVLATPGWKVEWRRHVGALGAGVVALMLGHLLMLTAFDFIIGKYELSKAAYLWSVPVWVLNDSLPFVLWLSFFPNVLTDLFPRIRFGSDH